MKARKSRFTVASPDTYVSSQAYWTFVIVFFSSDHRASELSGFLCGWDYMDEGNFPKGY